MLKDRVDKFLSREFLLGILPFTIGCLSLFLVKDAEGNPWVEFDQWAFWSAIFLGISGASLTVQKGLLKKG